MPAPRPERRPVTRRIHGTEAVDDYASLRDDDRTAAEVRAHLEAENAHVDEVLGHTADLQATLFQEIKRRVQETDLSVPRRRGDHWYFTRTEEGQQYRRHCRIPAGDDLAPPDPDAAGRLEGEQVLLDENVEAGDGDYFALGVFELDCDHRLLAWADDRNGSERYTLRFRDLGTGADADDLIDEVAAGGVFSSDGRWFLYTRLDDAMRPHEVWCHRLGSDPADDVRLLREDDERFVVHVDRTSDDAWLVIGIDSAVTSELRMAPAADPSGEWQTVVPRRQGIEAHLDHRDGTLYILTNDDALDFRVVTAPTGTTDPAEWVDLVPHTVGVRIESFDLAAGSVVLHERTEATTRLRVVDPATGDSTIVDQDEAVATVAPFGHPEHDWPLYRYVYTSMVTPPTIIELDLRSGERFVRKVTPVLGGYDPSHYETRRIWATAPDGTQVPVSIVARRDRRSPGPVLLYGYGSYEISTDPAFGSARLSLLDRGWAYAIAHVRGGGEMGRRWYLDGKFEHKTNSFDDLVAAGRALVDDGCAEAGRIAIYGGSAGGLLVGAALNRAPDLWGAVVAAVPFVDALNTMLDASLPLTVGEWEEWGNPDADPAVFAAMATYTPYENVPATVLPPVFATTGLHDPRVGYWEPAKWIARLRDVATGGGPFLLKTELGAGHGGPSGRYDAWKETALTYAFLLDVLGDGTFEAPA